ncbi:hypothetical protein HDU87_003604 [Geranomyces variabilis]|uniref:WD40 repeat-like protein n=1 Tax=Geranomyces variabilis TaxID=109894 RepID=A0AAD5TPL3_9FUNG|nr:hypothetical protein HDU87_003604 [Geranomyces variabilis]
MAAASSSDTRDLDLLAFSLIAQFLAQHNLSGTLDALHAEVPHVFSELNAHKAQANASTHRPLTAILEEHLLANFNASLAGLDLGKKRDPQDDGTLGLGAIKGCLPVADAVRVLEGVHFANILTSTIKTMPSSLFPDAADISMPAVSILITSSTDKTVRLSHADTGRTLCVLDHHKSAVLATDVYPADPAYILTAGMDGVHHIADVRTGLAVQSWMDHGKYVVRAAFSAWGRGEWFVTASYDRTVNFYRRTTSEDASPPVFEKAHSVLFRGAVESMCFLEPPRRAAAIEATQQLKDDAPLTVIIGCRDDNRLHYIELDPSRGYPSTTTNMNANGDDWISFTAADLCVSPTGKYVACYTDSKAGRIIIFAARADTQARNLWGVVADGFSRPRCCWDSSGRYLFATSDDRLVYVFDVASGQVVAKLGGHSEVVRCVAFDADSRRLLSCSFDKTVRIWDTAEGEDAELQR